MNFSNRFSVIWWPRSFDSRSVDRWEHLCWILDSHSLCVPSVNSRAWLKSTSRDCCIKWKSSLLEAEWRMWGTPCCMDGQTFPLGETEKTRGNMKAGTERWCSLWPRLVRNDFAPVCYFPLRSASFHRHARVDTPGRSDGDRSARFPAWGVGTLSESRSARTAVSGHSPAWSERSHTGWVLTHSILEKLAFEQDLSWAWHLQKAPLKWSRNVSSHFPDSPHHSWQNGRRFKITQ